MKLQILTDYAISKISGSYRFHKNYENALEEIFINEDYNWLVTGLRKKTIAIDIGAFCGESALYMAREKNIEKIYAYEPFPFNYSIAQKNISKSQYQKKIKLTNAGVSNHDEVITLSNASQTMTARAKKQKVGKEVQILNFNHIAPKAKNIIIKSDCEGEEHNIFKEDTNLDNVYKMQIEYHAGLQNLPRILEEKGFKLRTEKVANTILSGEVGWIYAYK